MNSKTYAAIDVGSNSVRLMVAQLSSGQLTPLKTGLITTRLLNGVTNGVLSTEAIERTAQAVAAHTATARALGAGLIHAFGTSALRDAQNSSLFSDRTEQLCGLRVNVISGVEEARLAYAGAAPSGRCGVIDIGGGSTELIVGHDGQMLRAHSAQLGAVRLMNDLNGRQNLQEMLAVARVRLMETIKFVCADPVERWMGVGGTITSLAAMTRRVDKYTPGSIENFPLDMETIRTWLDRLAKMSVSERKTLIGLPAARADIIVYGAAILLAVMESVPIQIVHACDHDNLEGYIRRHMLPCP